MQKTFKNTYEKHAENSFQVCNRGIKMLQNPTILSSKIMIFLAFATNCLVWLIEANRSDRSKSQKRIINFCGFDHQHCAIGGRTLVDAKTVQLDLYVAP